MTSATVFTHTFPAEYTGPVNLHITPTQANIGHDVHVTISWGRWSRDITLSHVGADGETLVFSKLDPGVAVPLHVTTDPRASVEAATGSAPNAIDLNDDLWAHS